MVEAVAEALGHKAEQGSLNRLIPWRTTVTGSLLVTDELHRIAKKRDIVVDMNRQVLLTKPPTLLEKNMKSFKACILAFTVVLTIIEAAAIAQTAPDNKPSQQAGPTGIKAAPTNPPTGPGARPPAQQPQGATPAPTVQLKPGEVPKAEFDTPIYDFGKAKTGKDIEHDFWFHNTGNGPLELVSVKPSCGCTTTTQYDKVVQPGQSGKITIKLATGHSTGPISKSITVVTNVPGANSTITLQVKGELWQAIQATPNSALFGNISAAQTKEGAIVRKLTIANNTNEPVKLGDLKSTNAAFKGEMKELEPGKKWELVVTLGATFATGVQSGMIEMATGMADLPKLNISCSAMLVADVDVVPNKMMLPATRAVNMQRDFYVRVNGTKPVKVFDVAAGNPLIKVGLQETQTGMAYRITMDVPPEYKVPKDGDKITFKTDHPNYPTITIPVTEAPASAPLAQNLPASSAKPARSAMPIGSAAAPASALKPAAQAGPAPSQHQHEAKATATPPPAKPTGK